MARSGHSFRFKALPRLPVSSIEHPTPVVVMAGRHRAFWMVVRLIGVLIALLILPVLIVLNLLLYLVILPAAVQAITG